MSTQGFSKTGGLVLAFSLTALSAVQAKDAKTAPITFDKHVLPIFESKCVGCHNPDIEAGGLDLSSYDKTMAGGSSGEVIAVGSAESSKLYRQMNHSERPFMPPESPKMSAKKLGIIKQWIESGARQNKNSKVKVVKKKTTVLKLPSFTGKAPTPPALSMEPFVKALRANSILSLSSSPGAAFSAFSAYKQVVLVNHDLSTRGILSFPEGQPRVVRFSPNGSVLLAAGGRGAHSGRVVLWNLKTGARLANIGRERDSVMAADINAGHSLVAMGGSTKKVRVYSLSTQERLYEVGKHTEWITALAFSPDGVLLATGDRNGGLIVWEAETGREFLTLKGHSAAVSSLSWRGDSNVLMSASEDRTIRLWRAEDGAQIRRWNAHGGGVLTAAYVADGRLISGGRDRTVRIWNQNGKRVKQFTGVKDLPLSVSLSADKKTLIAGDFRGFLTSWDVASGKRKAQVAGLPATLSQRLGRTKKRLRGHKAKSPKLQKDFQAAKVKLDECRAKVQSFEAELKDLKAARQQLKVSWTKDKRAFETSQSVFKLEQQRAQQQQWAKDFLLKTWQDDRALFGAYPRDRLSALLSRQWRIHMQWLDGLKSWTIKQPKAPERSTFVAKRRQFQERSKALEARWTKAKRQVQNWRGQLKPRTKVFQKAKKLWQDCQRAQRRDSYLEQRWQLEEPLAVELRALATARGREQLAKDEVFKLEQELAAAKDQAKTWQQQAQSFQVKEQEALRSAKAARKYFAATAILQSQYAALNASSMKQLKLQKAWSEECSVAASQALKIASDLPSQKEFVDAAAKAWDLAVAAKQQWRSSEANLKALKQQQASLVVAAAAAQNADKAGQTRAKECKRQQQISQQRLQQATAEAERMEAVMAKARSQEQSARAERLKREQRVEACRGRLKELKQKFYPAQPAS